MEQSTYKTFLDAGEKYAQTSYSLVQKKKRFSADLVYNIMALSIENYLVGFLQSKGDLPESHTLLDIILYVKKYHDVGNLEQEIKWMNRFQEVCCIDFYKRRVPNDEDLDIMLDLNGKVKKLVESGIGVV